MLILLFSPILKCYNTILKLKKKMTEKLKSCLLVNEDLAVVGGAEKIIRQTALELNQKGFHAGLVSSREFKPSTGLEEFVLPFFTESQSPEKTLEYAQEVISLMKTHGYDLLHIYSADNHDLIEKLSKDVPIVKTVSDSRPVCPSENRIKADGALCIESVGEKCVCCMEELGFSYVESNQRLTKTLRGIETMNRFSFIFTPSEYMRQQLLLNGLDPRMVKVIPLFLSHLSPRVDKVVEVSPELFKSDLLFVGRLIRAKGIDELLEAFSLLQGDYNLTIVGEHPPYTKPKDFPNERDFGGRVRFTGWVDNEKVDNYYQGTKVCVIPSMWPEVFGIVGLEAMRNKKPIVAFDTGGISEWLQDGENGILVPRGDIDRLSQQIQFLLEHPDLAEQMGEKGYQILASHFTAKKHIDHMLYYYEQI